jgi:hypothetical protein
MPSLLHCHSRVYLPLLSCPSRPQGYKADLEMYKAQKPIEELRLRLLADAGLEAHPTLVRPRKPSMLVLLPRPMLKRMLRDGIRMVEDRKRAAMAARRAEAEAIWLQKQEVGCGEVRCRLYCAVSTVKPQ